VDTEVHRQRPALQRAQQEVTAFGVGSSRSTEKEGLEGLIVESDYEGENDSGQEPSDHEEVLYPEEILTYKRRPRQPMVVEDHTIEGILEDDVMSDEENAPAMDDIPTTEM
jgi:hypothetical protein